MKRTNIRLTCRCHNSQDSKIIIHICHCNEEFAIRSVNKSYILDLKRSEVNVPYWNRFALSHNQIKSYITFFFQFGQVNVMNRSLLILIEKQEKNGKISSQSPAKQMPSVTPIAGQHKHDEDKHLNMENMDVENKTKIQNRIY